MNELPIIQKTYDLIKWYIPVLDRLPRQHRFNLGDRLGTGLYDLLEGLLAARYSSDKAAQLQAINLRLEVLRYQTRLLHDFDLIDTKKLEFISRAFNNIGTDLGGWIKQQKSPKSDKPMLRTP
jgi:hypothetical protein